jgi:NTE family protein
MDPRPILGVFAGGGIKGIALAGAAAGAMECGYTFERAIGTSSGALVASLVIAGYGADELGDAVLEIPWPELADPVPLSGVPFIGKHLSFVFGMGQCSGRTLERVWRGLLREKGVRRFGDLPPDSLKVVATDLTHQRGVVIPDHLVEYGIVGSRFSVARAVVMSSAVPFFFRPVPLRSLRSGRSALMADGALTSNFPLGLARTELPMFGFRFTDAEAPRAAMDIRGPASLVRAVVAASVRASGTVRGTLMDMATLIEIPADRDPLDFDVTPYEARRLFEGGRTAAVSFFDQLEEEAVLSYFRPKAAGS